MAQSDPTPKSHIAQCPECEQDVDLGKGDCCPNCGLDVAWCLEKRRRDRAVDKLRKLEEGEPKKKPGWAPFS